MKTVLLAAGLGTRLRPLTDTTAKCLVPVGGRALLDWWFELFGEAGLRDVLVNTHHLAEQVRSYVARVNAGGRFRVVESFEPALLGSAGTIHATRDWADDADDVLIVYADNLSDVDLDAMLRFHAAHGDPFTMMLFRAERPASCGIAQIDGQGRITEFVEKPKAPKGDLANAGVYVVTAGAYREMADMNAFDLGFDVLPKFAGRMRGFPWSGYHRDIGDVAALAKAEDAVRDGRLRHVRPAGEANGARRPAVFLDRDGTIIEQVHHIRDPADVRLIPRAADALRLIRGAGLPCVVVSNQSAVGRGLMTLEDVERVQREVVAQLRRAGADVDGFYFCPVAPRDLSRADREAVEHPDRKPAPGMLVKAANELALDLSRSWMVGDMLSDLLAGRNAGVRGVALVRTGHGQSVGDPGAAADHVAEDLFDAAQWIVSCATGARVSTTV